MGAVPVYEISGLEHRYGRRLAMRCPALRIEPGRIAGIRGPNGAGKSTLLQVMAFLIEPTRGEVLFMGEPARYGDVSLRRRAVLMPQDPALLRRSVEANVLYGLKVRGLPAEGAAHRALELVGLAPSRYLKRWWNELSGGEARRVALAARLALGPQVLLLDEPTASLDPQSADMVRQALAAARDRSGLTSVVVSHDREWLDLACDETHNLEPVAGNGSTGEDE
jgi:tungstate transport system ATP-binding protein